VHPQKEEDWGNVNPIGLRSQYDEGKRFAESSCMTYHRKFGVNVILARIFNTYGPKMQINDGRIVPTFVPQALRNEPITVFGDGSQTRSLCYVDDSVKGLCALMFSEHTGEVFNMGNPDEHSVLDLAQIIKEACNSKSKIIFKELPMDDPIKRKPDIEKIRTAIGWEPETSLKAGMAKTVEWFKKEIGQSHED
jgi:nucleoside-diphosphate-sugar epimerase